MNIDDWGTHRNIVWIFVHLNDLNQAGVMFVTATQQDWGFQMNQNVAVEKKLNERILKA